MAAYFSFHRREFKGEKHYLIFQFAEMHCYERVGQNDCWFLMLLILPYFSYSLLNGRLPSSFLSFCNVDKSLHPTMSYTSKNIFSAQCNADLYFHREELLLLLWRINWVIIFSNSYIIKSLYLLKITVSRQELDCSI